MKLDVWRPFVEIEPRLESWFRMPRLLTDGEEFPFRPEIDVERKDGALVVSAELPGIDPEKDVEITIDDDYLTIEGEKTEAEERTEGDRFVRERRYGKFVRRIPVPDGVRADGVEADYTDGILTVKVTLPAEPEATEPRKIPVTAAKH